MHDATTFLIAVGAFVLLLVGAVFLYRQHRARELAEEAKREIANANEKRRLEAERKKQLDANVLAGTHLETGERRCRHCPADAPSAAVVPTVHFVRLASSHRSWKDVLPFQTFRLNSDRSGYQAVWDGDPAYCATHSALVGQVAASWVAQHEERLASFLVEQDAERAHFESRGLDLRVAELIAKQAPESKRRRTKAPDSLAPAKVVDIKSGSRT